MEEVYRTNSSCETEELAEKLSATLSGFIALYGRMGAGKTAFVRGFVRALYPDVRVSSPTYTVMNVYSENLYHLDLYRLCDADDLESVGFYDIPRDATVLCEWAEHLPSEIKADVSIYFEVDPMSDMRILKVIQ